MDKIKLLVIDDNKEFCSLVRDYASMQDDIEFVGAAFDGIAGLEMIERKMVDVVLLDNIMPNLDGLGVLKRLNENPSKSKPKVITVTACPTEEFTTNAFKLGVSYAMSRKSDINEMLDRCRMVVKSNKIVLKDTCPVVEDVEVVVTNVLREIGVSASLSGYPCLRTAIVMAIKDPKLMYSVTKILYHEVASTHASTPIKVERNMRNAIENVWKKGNMEVVEKYFGTTIANSDKRPTNSEFIATLADKIRLDLKNVTCV